MRKILYFFTFLFLTINMCCLKSKSFKMRSNDLPVDPVPLIECETDLQKYYYHLVENYGRNQIGSCGYIAVAMLLSFYDSYLNDNIIPENYDIKGTYYYNNVHSTLNSPGILMDEEAENVNIGLDNNLYGRNYSNYKNFLESNSNICYQAYLELLGIDLGFVENHSILLGTYADFSTTSSNLATLLNTTLGFVYNSNEFTVYEKTAVNYINENYTGISMKQDLINQINNGKPVIIGIRRGRDDHAAVAYDVDSNNNIYFHDGISNCRMLFDETMDLKTIIYVDFDSNIQHEHSDNYICKNMYNLIQYDKDVHCSCNYSYLSTFNAYYVDNCDDETHEAYSLNGEHITRRHNFTLIRTNSTNELMYVPKYKCTYCNALKIGNIY